MTRELLPEKEISTLVKTILEFNTREDLRKELEDDGGIEKLGQALGITTPIPPIPKEERATEEEYFGIRTLDEYLEDNTSQTLTLAYTKLLTEQRGYEFKLEKPIQEDKCEEDTSTRIKEAYTTSKTIPQGILDIISKPPVPEAKTPLEIRTPLPFEIHVTKIGRIQKENTQLGIYHVKDTHRLDRVLYLADNEQAHLDLSSMTNLTPQTVRKNMRQMKRDLDFFLDVTA